MADFDFSLERKRIDPKFITLGKLLEEATEDQLELVNRKVTREVAEKNEVAWATLGWEDDRPFEPEGTIHFSEDGHLESISPVTIKEIENIYAFNKLLNNNTIKVRERYINFDDVDFKLKQKEYKIDELPKLRLTLFLEDDEGAIVYYQHSDREKYHDSKNAKENDLDPDIEYILPNPAETGRDRLTYEFPVIPGNIEESDDDDRFIEILEGNPVTSFLVKILTYKRGKKQDHDLIEEELETLNAQNLIEEGAHRLFGKRKYKLHIFDVNGNHFEEVSTQNPIDFSKKTLLLVHGTFSTIAGSYGAAFESDYAPRNNIFQKLIAPNGGVFEQIIGFDHPTITHGAVENVAELYNMLGSGNKFTKQVSLVGTSRGALVCKQLANDTQNKHFEVDCILTYSGANGVGYFEKAKYIVELFKVLKKTGGPIAKVLALFAQFSAERFLEMPGCKVMTPKSAELRAILETDPVNKNIHIQCVGADWHRKLYKERWKRIPAVLLDTFLKLILGRKHDWVVGRKHQLEAPEKYKVSDKYITAVHTRVLDVRKHVRNGDSHKIMKDFFSMYSTHWTT